MKQKKRIIVNIVLLLILIIYFANISISTSPPQYTSTMIEAKVIEIKYNKQNYESITLKIFKSENFPYLINKTITTNYALRYQVPIKEGSIITARLRQDIWQNETSYGISYSIIDMEKDIYQKSIYFISFLFNNPFKSSLIALLIVMFISSFTILFVKWKKLIIFKKTMLIGFVIGLIPLTLGLIDYFFRGMYKYIGWYLIFDFPGMIITGRHPNSLKHVALISNI